MTTYSFIDVVATLAGPGGSFSLGYGAGNAEEGITVAMDDDKTSTITGADGQIMHSLHAGRTGSITVTLLKTSPVNAQLSQLYSAQQQASITWGQNILLVSDPSRGDVLSGHQLAFVKHPDIVYAREGNTNAWVFRGVITQLLGPGTPGVV